jgi:hypothetical protein
MFTLLPINGHAMKKRSTEINFHLTRRYGQKKMVLKCTAPGDRLAHLPGMA